MRTLFLTLAASLAIVACSSNNKPAPTPPNPGTPPSIDLDKLHQDMIDWCNLQPNADEFIHCRCMDYPMDGSDEVCENPPPIVPLIPYPIVIPE